jgi:DNA-binding transcriptional regulator YbjK
MRVVDLVKAWMTPGLLIVVWFFVRRDLTEIRSDIKELRETMPVVTTKVAALESATSENVKQISQIWMQLAAKHEEEYRVPVVK